jgi:hypothetical protein
MRVRCCTIWIGIFFASAIAAAQKSANPESLLISDKEVLPPASLWKPYDFRFQISGGVLPYHWRIISGSLPRRIELDDAGELRGIPDDAGTFEFTTLVRDNHNPPKQTRKKFVLSIETPLSADWGKRAQVSGNRIDGSVKVSNRTGRSFDLTIIILAVNDIGRATAIGYQHFDLKNETRDLDIPFGDTLSPGNYAVNVDVVAEEPISNRIFRARLTTGKEAVTQGP